MNFSQELLAKATEAEALCLSSGAFAQIERTARANGERVLRAFANNRVEERHLFGSNGYGYGDDGRDTLDRVYAEVFGAESAIVRHNFINGTHAITVGMFGVMKAGGKLVSVTGKPYDTLNAVINGGGLREQGVEYAQVDLLADSTPDFAAIAREAATADAVFVQRSRGYSLRKPLTVAQIGEIVRAVKAVNSQAAVIVDNCYGEFCEEFEPCAVGVDLVMGSLIKNPGGAIAETGGYIAGRADLVERCADRLTVPGLGRKAGCSLNTNRSMYLGFFLAPEVVASALKTSAFASALFGLLGYEVSPAYDEHRTDLIAAISLGSADKVCAFCEGVQAGSPVDSFITPVPWDMPGYDNQVIMAAGTFTAGASIELSADAPIREPFTVFLQGGITFASGRIGVLSAARRIM